MISTEICSWAQIDIGNKDDNPIFPCFLCAQRDPSQNMHEYLRFNMIHILKSIVICRYRQSETFVRPGMPLKWPPLEITNLYKTTITTCIPKCTWHSPQKCWYIVTVWVPLEWQLSPWWSFCFSIMFLWLIHICTCIYFLNAIEVAWENQHALGVAIDVPKARTEEQSRPVWRWDASSTPKYTLGCSVTRGQPGGYPRPPSSHATGACFGGRYLRTGSSSRQNHAWGCYKIKHGFNVL